MPKYAVTIEGHNFPGRLLENTANNLGFFATRWVEATNPETAELAAVELIREEYRELAGERQEDEPNPTLHLDEIIEIDKFPAEYENRGATWFPMGTD